MSDKYFNSRLKSISGRIEKLEIKMRNQLEDNDDLKEMIASAEAKAEEGLVRFFEKFGHCLDIKQ